MNKTLLAIAACVLMATPAFAQVSPPALPPYVNAGAPFQPISNVYLEDFEANDGGFTALGNASWEWGQPTVHVQPTTGQGPGMWATNLAGTYNDRACGSITSPAIDLTSVPTGAQTGARAARLVFRHWMQSELSWDGGVVQVSTNGGANWTTLDPVGGADASMISSEVRACLGTVSGQKVFSGPSGTTLPAPDDWELAEVDLTGYLGQSIQLRWAFAADSSAVRLGWYVDDIAVQLGVGASVRVDIPTVEPASGVAFSPATVLFAEDFEATNGDWVASGTSTWEWGEAVAPPLPPTGSLNMWGTHLATDYLPNECAYLTSPSISLPGADPTLDGVQAARMTMQVWRFLRSGYDAAQLQVSTDDGASWRGLTPEAGYDRTLLTSGTDSVRACLGIASTDRVWSGPSSAPKPEAWLNATFDLTPYLGDDIKLRIAFASGSASTPARGIYMGDVLIEIGVGAVFPDPSNPTLPGASAPGWSVVGNGSWEYGVATTGPLSLSPVWATNLGGIYAANECQSIVSPAIDTNNIVGLGRLELNFEHFHQSDSADDFGVVMISDDAGATWDLVTPYSGYPSTLAADARACFGVGLNTRGFSGAATGNEYDAASVPLQSYQGKTILVRFAWFSDASVQDLGWYVRGVELTRGGVPLPLGFSAELPLAQAIVMGVPHGELGLALAGLERPVAMETMRVLSAPFFESVTAIVEATGGEVLAYHPSVPAVAVKANAPTLAILAAREDVTSVVEDGDQSVKLVDPVFDSEENDLGATNTQGRAMLQAEDAWAAGFMGEGVRITMIDTGIDATHEAFKYANGSTRVAKWLDLVNGNPNPYDDQGHGTHVAGTAVGSDLYVDPTFGKYTEVGVAPRATLYVAKFLNSGGSGSFTNAIAALEWAFNQSSDITSNSWGSSCSSGANAVMASVRTLTDAGMLNVFAAGNSGPGSSTIGAPACSESALSVGAVGSNGVIASFSSRGPCSDLEAGGPSRICPDIVAKGYLVNSAAGRSGCSLCSPSGYKVLNGTSMATPHAAGAAAISEQMKRSVNGGVGWNTAARAEEQVFKLTSMDLGSPAEDNTYGWGLPQLMNVYAILLDTDEANIVPTFAIGDSLLRQGETSSLLFAVRNLGGAVASGSFVATLTSPNGSVTTLKSTTPSLALLDSESYSGAFTVTNNVGFGNYTFRGRFDYTWTNSTSGETHNASILREGTIEVKRVQVQVTLEGLGASALPLELQEVSYTARNIGNEDATRVTIEFTVPDDYVFVPGANFDPLVANSRYADPAPDSVVQNSNYGRVTLVFDVGSLPQGASFSFTTKLLPTTLGDYRVVSVAKYFDGANNAFSSGLGVTQEVGLGI